MPTNSQSNQRLNANSEAREYPCDLCRCDDAVEIAIARQYTNDQPIHVCSGCGFVYVRRRRSAEEIARAWTEELFQKAYTARIPAVVARHAYLAAFVESVVGWRNKRVCDIGAGEGKFLELIRRPEFGAKAFAVEPSAGNCGDMEAAGIECFNGTIEDFVERSYRAGGRFDVVTILWTLENCRSWRTMLKGAHNALVDGGHVAVATGSRILVPFKKPLYDYFSAHPADTHCFRFSANTLHGALAVSGFEPVHVNRYLDTDYLVMVGRKVTEMRPVPWTCDDPNSVLEYFERWHAETQAHFVNR